MQNSMNCPVPLFGVFTESDFTTVRLALRAGNRSQAGLAKLPGISGGAEGVPFRRVASG